MQDRAKEIKVGLTVLIGVAILVGGILWGKGVRLGARRFPLVIQVDNTSGLGPGDPVTVNGVSKGAVARIALEGTKVFVTVMLDRDVRLFTDASAVITSVELMGGKKVEIYPGQGGTPINPDQPPSSIPGKYAMGIPELMGVVGELALRLGAVASRADTVLATLNSTFGDARLSESLKAGIENLAVTSRELRRLTQQNNTKFTQTLDNFQAASDDIKHLVVNRRSEIDTALTHIVGTARQMEEFTRSLDEFAQRIRNRQGSLGQLLYDEKTFAQLQRAVDNIDSLSTDLRKNLARYLQNTRVHLINLIDF